MPARRGPNVHKAEGHTAAIALDAVAHGMVWLLQVQDLVFTPLSRNYSKRVVMPTVQQATLMTL
jgi:hypothetical protein